MNGRISTDEKKYETIENKLKEMPEFVNEWYDNLRASRVTASSCFDMVYKINKFLSYINKNVKEIKLDDINKTNVSRYIIATQTKYDKNGIVTLTSDSYQCSVWSCLNNFLGYLYDMGYINMNYIQTIKKPKNNDIERITRNRKRITESDFKQIAIKTESVKNYPHMCRDKAIIMVLMNTGIRRTALIDINVSDIDVNNKTLIVIDKGKKERFINLNDATFEAIEKWLEVRKEYGKNIKEDALFISNKGNRISETALYSVVKKYAGVSPHKLRAGYCTILYDKTGNIEFVRKAVGHKSSQVTQRYIVTNGEEAKKASEIMDSLF